MSDGVENVTGIILAGGQSSRMGTNKALLKVGRQSIIDNIVTVYKQLFDEIFIVTNDTGVYDRSDLRLVRDVRPGLGPLCGIYSGLKASSRGYCFVTACDMPFIDADLLSYMASFRGFDVTIPVISGKYEPLFALYSTNCLPVMKNHIENGRLHVISILPKLSVREVKESEMRSFDNSLLSLRNINTPEDYDTALGYEDI